MNFSCKIALLPHYLIIIPQHYDLPQPFPLSTPDMRDYKTILRLTRFVENRGRAFRSAVYARSRYNSV